MNDIKAIVAELERLERVASPAPWPEDYCQGAVRHISRNVEQDVFYDGSFDGWSRYNDGPLIAATRNALPALLAELRRLWHIEEAAVRYRDIVKHPVSYVSLIATMKSAEAAESALFDVLRVEVKP